MDYKNILHRLVDCQQFTELKANAQHYLNETADKQVLPLLALAHAHLGERTEAVTISEQAEAQLDVLDLDARVDLAQMQGRTQQVIHLLRRAIALLKEQDETKSASMARKKKMAGLDDEYWPTLLTLYLHSLTSYLCRSVILV